MDKVPKCEAECAYACMHRRLLCVSVMMEADELLEVPVIGGLVKVRRHNGMHSILNLGWLAAE